MNLLHLITILVFGVIIADLVAHVSGTTALFNGVNVLTDIGLQPTNTALLSKTLKKNKKGQ